MKKISFEDHEYEVDSDGFLLDPESWDERFAIGTASIIGIESGLSEEHWNIVRYIRSKFEEEGKCPLVYQACRANNLNLSKLKELFPTGYLRGACLLAGLTYRQAYVKYSWVESEAGVRPVTSPEKVYRVDVWGFLIDPDDWDIDYAINKAEEMKLPRGLTDEHMKVLKFLRGYFKEHGVLPTVHESCEANNLELDDCERLFPDGYHRGAVKIAGLRHTRPLS